MNPKPVNPFWPTLTAFVIGFVNVGLVLEGMLWWFDDFIGLGETAHLVSVVVGLVLALAFALHAARRAAVLYRALNEQASATAGHAAGEAA